LHFAGFAANVANPFMRNIFIASILLVLIIAGCTAWQVGAAELANTNLRDDMQDMGSQVGTHIGFNRPPTDDEMTQAVIRKAGERGIELRPNQITVRRVGEEPRSTFYLAADYNRTVNLLVFSFSMHFTPSSEK
jgi:hypothetical protein